MTRKNGTKQTSRSGVLIVLLAFCLMLGMAGEAVPVAASQVQQGTTPIAINDFYVYTSGQMLTVAAPGVLANDTDPEGDTLTAVLASGPTYGTLTLQLNGGFTYTPDADHSSASFTYFASDGTNTSATATVTLNAANCFLDQCPGEYTCSSNDVKVASITTFKVIDYCTYEGDTGIYTFLVQYKSTADQRYDPTAYIALDGSDADHGYCAKDYLQPMEKEPYFTQDTWLGPDPFWGPPFWELEDKKGDMCGDIVDDWTVAKITEPLTVYCTAGVLDGYIDAVAGWHNNDKIYCDGGACSDVSSKCTYSDLQFEVRVDPIDLSITKSVPEGTVITPGVPFQYTLTVTNNTDKKSHGYNVYDDLPMWLKVVEGEGSPFIPQITDPNFKDYYEDDGTSEDGPFGDNAAEWCSTNGHVCDGYGDIVWFNEQTDLGPYPGTPTDPNSRTYTFWVMLWDNDEETRTYCEAHEGDPRCLVGGGENPDEIENTACVEGFDRDTDLTDNCGPATAPTAVELLYFTAKPGEKAITLAWATSNEINNAGFNIYRSTSQDGRRIKLNPELIPAQKRGTTEGAEYLYIDSSLEQPWFKKALDRILKRSTTYYYWLEDVPLLGEAELFGPESAQLLR